jgi:hypothetical protein
MLARLTRCHPRHLLPWSSIHSRLRTHARGHAPPADPPAGQDQWVATQGGFACALDLVKHIKQHYGDYFCISVAGACTSGHQPCFPPALAAACLVYGGD